MERGGTGGLGKTAEVAQILVVDDDEPTAALLSAIVRTDGFDAVSAGSVAAARMVLAEQHVDLVICDVQMPGGSGLELTAEISRDLPHVAVFMLSGHDDLATADAALRLGATAYVVKPFTANEVLINVHNGLRIKELERSRWAFRNEVEDRVLHRSGHLNNALQTLQARPTEGASDELLERLAAGMGLRQGGGIEHLYRLSGYATVLGRASGLDGADLEALHWAAVLHDIGQVGVPDQILERPHDLDPEERETFERHAELGWHLLQQYRGPRTEMAALVALSRHERWDGSGYPAGLAAEDIPLPARIVAVVDEFEALTARRSERPALSVDNAVVVLQEHQGTKLDPELVRLFMVNLEAMRDVRSAHLADQLGEIARVLLVDAHVLFTDSVAHLLARDPGLILVGAASTAQEAIDAMRRHRPDVVLIDSDIVDGDGHRGLQRVMRERPDTTAIMLTDRRDDVVLLEALRLGVTAVLSKRDTARNLVQTIWAAHHGDISLSPTRVSSLLAHASRNEHGVGGITAPSPRELEVLDLVAQGLEIRAIAETLSLSTHTVRNHLRHAMEKLGAHTRLEAVAEGVRRGFIRIT